MCWCVKAWFGSVCPRERRRTGDEDIDADVDVDVEATTTKKMEQDRYARLGQSGVGRRCV